MGTSTEKKTLIVKSTCPECKGTGKYTVLNAYDDSYSEEVVCEYCGGDGYILCDLMNDTETLLSEDLILSPEPAEAALVDEWPTLSSKKSNLPN